MTNHWIDLKNSDCILIMGSNAAENHPISMKYVTEAQSRGGKLISVDPRFTRTSAKADIYAPLRSGTDIAFLGGMIKYIIDNKLYNEEYVVAYTDAAFLVGEGFDFKDGLFSGYDTRQAGLRREQVDLPAGRERRAQEGFDASGQTLRVPAAESPLRPLHPGSGLQDHRHPGEGPAGGLQGLRRHRRQGQGRHHHVRHGLDPAHRRRPEHPRHVHHPDAARQHGGGRRRRERPARGVQRPGLHRPRPAVPHPARLHRNPGHQLAEARGLPETPGQEQRPAERQLVAERAQVHGQPAQGLLRRCRHGGQRVRLPVDAQAGCRQGLQLARSLRRHVQWGASKGSSPGA